MTIALSALDLAAIRGLAAKRRPQCSSVDVSLSGAERGVVALVLDGWAGLRGAALLLDLKKEPLGPGEFPNAWTIGVHLREADAHSFRPISTVRRATLAMAYLAAEAEALRASLPSNDELTQLAVA